jgi:hypothetical protein
MLPVVILNEVKNLCFINDLHQIHRASHPDRSGRQDDYLIWFRPFAFCIFFLFYGFQGDIIMEWKIALVWIGRILAAVVAGAMIGLERELRGKPAGLRTIVMITMGSAMFMIGSEIITIGPRFADSARVAAQIVTGVGFLGAGAIITNRNKILGLTTAATIWISAAIGLVIGFGEVGFGLFSAVVTVTVLIFLTQLEKRLLHPWAIRHGFFHVNGLSNTHHPSSTVGSGDYPQSIE